MGPICPTRCGAPRPSQERVGAPRKASQGQRRPQGPSLGQRSLGASHLPLTVRFQGIPQQGTQAPSALSLLRDNGALRALPQGMSPRSPEGRWCGTLRGSLAGTSAHPVAVPGRRRPQGPPLRGRCGYLSPLRSSNAPRPNQGCGSPRVSSRGWRPQGHLCSGQVLGALPKGGGGSLTDDSPGQRPMGPPVFVFYQVWRPKGLLGERRRTPVAVPGQRFPKDPP
ncbi:basic salivary proline-rich protein 2-like [Homarus americanus]|uniref:basic salivary proline-rich protein 2-like n=1 Tax=Homarus americanus TaxID=6706 RepID=UPI001C48704C|nr:basic salivary proline-rich protein 2-like [Homarus americanus]